jgi:hypothetical protein
MKMSTHDNPLQVVAIDDEGEQDYMIDSPRHGQWIVRETVSGKDRFEGRTFQEAIDWISEHPLDSPEEIVHGIIAGLRRLRSLADNARGAVNDPNASQLAKQLGAGVLDALALIDGRRS